MAYLYKVTLFFMAVAFLPLQTVIADKPAEPRSYTEVTQDSKYIFVMHAPTNIFGGYEAGKGIALKAKYKKSGLYENNGSKQPLWTVDWYASGVYVSSDGVHLIRMGHWPAGFAMNKEDLKQLAVAFYNKGNLIKEYLIADLIKEPDKLQQTISHFMWRKNVFYDDTVGQLRVETHDDQNIVFDLNGNIVE